MIRNSLLFVGLTFSALAVAQPAHAQRLADSRTAMLRAEANWSPPKAFLRVSGDTNVQPPSISLMAMSGTLLGTAGLFVGGVIGLGMENCGHSHAEDCGIGGFILGSLVGEAIGVPLGVHLGGGRRGSLGAEIVTSLGVTMLGVMAAYATDGKGILIIPPLQLVTSIVLERHAAFRGRSAPAREVPRG